MARIELEPSEYAVAQVIASMRRCVNQAAGVRDQRRDSMKQAIELDMLGAVAEVAFCKWQNVYPDLSVRPRRGSADALLSGKKVDVKATDRRNGRLIATYGKEMDQADIYVLAIVEDLVVDFVGYATAQDLLCEASVKDLGHGPTYALEQSQLRRFKEKEKAEV
jgi:hypothetical protein